MQIRTLRTLLTLTTIMVVLDALFLPTLLACAWSGVAWYLDNFIMINRGMIGFKIATAIVFGSWIYVAGRTLIAAGYDDCEFTPAARIWWFAVPIANFYMPFKGMRELWNASHGVEDYGANAPLVTLWWAAYLLVMLASWIAIFMTDPNSSAGALILVPFPLLRAIAAILMIHRITKALSEGPRSDRLEEVFA